MDRFAQHLDHPNPRLRLPISYASSRTEKQQPAIGKEKDASTVGHAVTLSGLLNVLDSFHAPENVVYVMTTNQVEALDPP